MASEGGHIDTVESLIAKGADISVKDKDGVSECDYIYCVTVEGVLITYLYVNFGIHALLKNL